MKKKLFLYAVLLALLLPASAAMAQSGHDCRCDQQDEAQPSCQVEDEDSYPPPCDDGIYAFSPYWDEDYVFDQDSTIEQASQEQQKIEEQAEKAGSKKVENKLENKAENRIDDQCLENAESCTTEQIDDRLPLLFDDTRMLDSGYCATFDCYPSISRNS